MLFLYKKIRSFFVDTNADNVLITQQIPSEVRLGPSNYMNTAFYLGPQPALTINPTSTPEQPVYQADLSLGALGVTGALNVNQP